MNVRGPVGPLRPVDPLPQRYERRPANPALPVERAIEGELIRHTPPLAASTNAAESFAIRAQAAAANAGDDRNAQAIQGAAFYRYVQLATAPAARSAPGQLLDYFA